MIDRNIVDLIKNSKGNPIQMDYDLYSGEAPFVFIDNIGVEIGYVWFKLNDGYMWIDMIEIIDKESGWGTKAIQFLFELYNLSEMGGIVLWEYSMRPYWFWESLGSNFDIDYDDMEQARLKGIDIHFSLKKDMLLLSDYF